MTHGAEFDMRYPGQEYSLTVQVALERGPCRRETPTKSPGASRSPTSATTAMASTVLSRSSPSGRSSGRRCPVRQTGGTTDAGTAARPSGHEIARAYSFARGEWCDFRIIERDALRPGDEFDGPAIVLETTTTSYFDDGFSGVVHDTGALVVTDTRGAAEPTQAVTAGATAAVSDAHDR